MSLKPIQKGTILIHSQIINKPQLVLDIAGVLLTNLSPLFWKELAHSTSVSYDILKTRFNEEIRNDLWLGKLHEIEFWKWLHNQCPNIYETDAKALLYNHIKPLPAASHLNDWSQTADIHLLSNHRKEWLDCFLSSVQTSVKSITISSEVGLCKPDPRIYDHIVRSHMRSTGKVLFVDDQDKNLKPAFNMGWNTLLADPQGKWVERVISLLVSEAIS
jgi:FMN phosphatase YigB (HAD superfamily)